jgi:methylmalonyl-CoA epimerase
MPEFTLDHVVIAVRDLDGATKDYATLLGRRPSWHGSHPAYGTRNTLFRIDNTYIELLSPGQNRSGPWAGELARFLDKGEGLYALALGTRDVDADTRLLRDHELPVQDPRDGDGIDELTGAHRAWRNAQVPVAATHGVRLFLIEHRSLPDLLPPATVSTEGGAHVRRMDHAVILSPDIEASRRLWGDALGARLALDRTFPERNTRIAFFRLGDITVEISGGAQQTEEGIGKPDRLWGVAWGVDNVTATVARLRAAGVEVSEPRMGVKPGTLVATAKGAHTHGVATLLIEHTAESFQPAARAPRGAAYDNAPQRRAFTATGLHHVAIAVTDAEAAADAWTTTLGIDAEDVLESPTTRLRIASLPGGDTKIALAAALREQHPIAEWIADRGQGMYAIAIQVDDIVAAAADLRAKGVPVGEVEYGAWPGTRVARIDRAAANGVSVQLVQRLPEVL